MRVVVVGSGGREHALASTLSRTAEVLVTPGNPGIAGSTPVTADELEADLFVIGPEIPLVAGLADRLRAQGKTVFGPGADGAQFEGSKTWMKQFFNRHGIPTAVHRSFDDPDEAVAFLDELSPPYVVKADGPAAGKGVLVAQTRAQAVTDIGDKLSGRAFGEAGRRVVVEQGLTGPEISVFALTDGKRFVLMTSAQDFKRVGDGDTGPNTGSMGSYSPAPIATKSVIDEIAERIFEPTITGLRAEGIDYRGVLYATPMLTPEGPKLLEYNVRFGDTEAQVIFPRFEGDLADLLAEVASGDLRSEPRFSTDAAVTVALAAEGYPTAPVGGDEITGIEAAASLPGVTIFHAGTVLDDQGVLRTAPGRVLNVTALGPTIADARARAYEAITRIAFRGMHYRIDIAAAAVMQEGAG